jgi:flagellar biosynthetic protein FliR
MWGYVSSTRIRVALCIVLSMLMMLVVDSPSEADQYVLQIIGEIFLGFLTGTLCRIGFWGVSSAGEWVEYHMGLGFGRLVDPSTQEESGILASINTTVCTALFFVSGFYRDTLKGLLEFTIVFPPGKWNLKPNIAMHVVEKWGDILSFVLFLSMPFVAVSLISHVSIAFLGKTVPQMSIWSVGFVIVIAVSVVFYNIYFSHWISDCIKILEYVSYSMKEIMEVAQ